MQLSEGISTSSAKCKSEEHHISCKLAMYSGSVYDRGRGNKIQCKKELSAAGGEQEAR